MSDFKVCVSGHVNSCIFNNHRRKEKQMKNNDTPTITYNPVLKNWFYYDRDVVGSFICIVLTLRSATPKGSLLEILIKRNDLHIIIAEVLLDDDTPIDESSILDYSRTLMYTLNMDGVWSEKFKAWAYNQIVLKDIHGIHLYTGLGQAAGFTKTDDGIMELELVPNRVSIFPGSRIK